MQICLGDGPIGAPGVVFPSLKVSAISNSLMSLLTWTSQFPAEKQPLAIICWDHLREIIFTRSHRVEGSGAHTTWIDFYFMNDVREPGLVQCLDITHLLNRLDGRNGLRSPRVYEAHQRLAGEEPQRPGCLVYDEEERADANLLQLWRNSFRIPTPSVPRGSLSHSA